ncbi:hypothetical protein IWX81_002527 [Salinibacterium sp. CAN_S4]
MDGNHGMIFLARRKHLRKPVDRLRGGIAHLFPEMQDAFHVFRVEISDTK